MLVLIIIMITVYSNNDSNDSVDTFQPTWDQHAHVIWKKAYTDLAGLQQRATKLQHWCQHLHTDFEYRRTLLQLTEGSSLMYR